MSSTQEAAATFNDATPASPETPIDEQETPSGDLIFSEGQLVLADNVIVQTHFVQLKEAPVFQWPQDLPVLVKGCPAEHAIENGARLRLSKPEVFRYDDGTRIGDPFEGVTQREERRVIKSLSTIQTIRSGRGSEARNTTLSLLPSDLSAIRQRQAREPKLPPQIATPTHTARTAGSCVHPLRPSERDGTAAVARLPRSPIRSRHNHPKPHRLRTRTCRNGGEPTRTQRRPGDLHARILQAEDDPSQPKCVSWSSCIRR